MELKFIGAGKYSDVFNVSEDGRAVIMKLSYYRDDTINNVTKNIRTPNTALAVKAKDSINVSKVMSKVASELIKDGVSPHFVLVFCEADCVGLVSKLRGLLRKRISTSTPTQLKFNHVCFMEVFTTDMTRWLRTEPRGDAIRATIFQVLYTLAALQLRLPGFRHNDLSTNNVLVKRLRKPFTGTYSTPVGDFYVGEDADLRALIALSDYDFAHAKVKGLQNERILSNKYKVSAANNNTYDTHFFLKSVMKNNKDPEVHAFLASLPLRKDIDRLEDFVNGKIKGIVVQGMEPLDILQHPYFNSLKLQKPTAAKYRM